MNRQEFLDYQKVCCNKMIEIAKAKNTDYAGAGDNAFANFTKVETLGIATTEAGFLTRMTDKLCRLVSFLNNGQLAVKDESVEDTLLDLANYCILMAAYIKSKRPPEKTESIASAYGIPFTVTFTDKGDPIK